MTAEEPKVALTARYSRIEAAKYLGISLRTLDRMKKDNIIKMGIRRVNGRPFFLGSEILRVWKSTY